MSATVFTLDVIATLILCALGFRHYASFRANVLVTAIVLYTWFLSFAIVFILPLDVSSVRTARPVLFGWESSADPRDLFTRGVVCVCVCV
jgi:hypothetical protein